MSTRGLYLVARVRPVSPTYRCWHCGHVIWYTTPHFCRSGVLSLVCMNKERMVLFVGRWNTPTSCARKILASFSEVPWIMLVLARFGLALSLDFQHGFQSGLSCESQLIDTVHDWITALDNKTQIDAILLDFAKAFDKVPHKRLLSKLTSYGITGNTHNWIISFLSNRKQRVSVNGPGALSDITDVPSGVPQGSVLGPILFLPYINDINTNVQSSIRLSADDSIIYRKTFSNIDHQILQTDLIQLEKWSDKWQMQFDISKCVHLPITNKTKPRSHQYYSLIEHMLSKVASHAYLGVKLDSKLSWAKHITEITGKSSKVLGMVQRTRCPCKPEVKDTAYNIKLVRPKLEYASPIWNPHTSSQINHQICSK